MPVTTSELLDLKTISRSVSFLGKHRQVDHYLLRMGAKQKEAAVRRSLTFRKRSDSETDQVERTHIHNTSLMQKLDGGYATDSAEKVLDLRGSLPSIPSVYHRALNSRDRAKVKDNNTKPLSHPEETIRSEQSPVETAAVTDRVHFGHNFRRKNDSYREASHRNRKYLMDLIGGRISESPATERKKELREDGDTVKGRVHQSPPLLNHNQHRPQLDVAENSGHHRRLRHHLSESHHHHHRSVTLTHNQKDIEHFHVKEPEEGSSKESFRGILKQKVIEQLKQSSNGPLKKKINNNQKRSINDFSKQRVDSFLKQTISDPLKHTISGQSQPTNEDPLKLIREDRLKPTVANHFKGTTEDPLNQTKKELRRSPSASFDVTQRKVDVRRTDGRQVQTESKKIVLDLLKGRNRRSSSGRKRFRVAAGVAPEGVHLRKPSRCDFYAFEDLKRPEISPSRDEKDVRKYIRDNDLMPPEKESWIRQWLRTVSPSIRDEDLEGDPAPAKP